MALFRRRPAPDDEPSADLAAPDAAPADPDAEEGPEVHDGPGDAGAPAEGPFDESEADRADQSIPRLDLGALLVPGLPGIGVQVEADPNTQEVRAVTGVGQEAAVQVQVFAAPRTEGIWEEIRAEMATELSATDGARVSENDGPFGRELRAVVPARSPEGKQVLQPLRFTGIDGPRWFLRAVFLGRAAVEPDPEDALHRLVRQIIVVRGSEAMAPRDPLPLRLPDSPPEGMAPTGGRAAADSADPADGDDLEDLEDDLEEGPDDGQEGGRFAGIDPFERGPEITEVR